MKYDYKKFLNINVNNQINFLKKFLIFNPRIFYINTEQNRKKYTYSRYKFAKSMLNYKLYEISKKLKTFPHTEYRTREFSSIKTIKNKMKIHTDLFNRGHTYKIVKIDRSYPKYIINNLRQFENYLE